ANVEKMVRSGAPHVVVLDSAQRLKTDAATGEARRHDVKSLAIAAVHYARRTGGIVILISQGNRASWRKRAEREGSSRLPASDEASIEFETDLLLFMEELNVENVSKVYISKGRLAYDGFDPETPFRLRLDRKRAELTELDERAVKDAEDAEELRV